MDRPRALTGILASVLITAVSACSTAPTPIAPPNVVGYPPVDPCPISEFWVPFAPASIELDGRAHEVLGAAANRAQLCVGEVMIVSRGYADLPELAERRAEVAYESLAERLSQQGVGVRSVVVLGCGASAEHRAALTIYPMRATDLDILC